MTVPALGSVYGGPSKSVIELAQSLGAAGIDVDLVTTNANGDKTVDVPIGQWIEKGNYRIQYFSYLGFGDYKFSLDISRWLLKNIQAYDLVQTNAIFSLPNLPAYLGCRWHNVPYVIIPRGMLEPWALSYKAWKKRIYYRLFEQPALQRASAIQMLASSEADQIQVLDLKSPLIISPNGIHREDFEVLPQPDVFYQRFPETEHKKLILFLGRIDPKKGLDFLAQAFGNAKRQFSDAHLVVAGPDNVGFLPTAKQYFSDHHCLDSVTFTGMLTGELKYAALAASNYYIAPSYSEGFSMSVLEGMAAGLPCILTTGCNFPEAAKANVANVADVDAKSVTAALLSCMNDPQASAAMGARAREFIFDNYTWNSIAGDLFTVYQSILNQQPFPQYA
ncbi:MAG: glycosyltransferase [Cyanobacteria bacterium J06634_5]